ncbi:MAG: hypothetical protein DRJ18_01435 [Candidatus Methanomethylicota archaeon]|nr:MAG: hypothetical protein DRJ18_01435 [Candidatus Verstraetearchaeota archaeon]
MGRRRLFFNKSYLGFAIEASVAEAFKRRCEELGIDYSQVLREFVHSFINARPVEEKRILKFDINLNIEVVERIEQKERKAALEYIRQLETQEFREKLSLWKAEITRTRNSLDCYNIKRSVITWLKKLKDIDNETLEQAKAVIELCEKRLEQLRRL